VPMILARDEPHSPELEAACEGENAVIVRSDSSDDLATALVQTARARGEWAARRTEIAESCAARYSVDVMADGVMAAIQPM
jgi:hypothetical protein